MYQYKVMPNEFATMDNSKIIVYLDSSDYSILTDPRRITARTQDLQNELIELSKHESVQFVYSAAHILEISPLKSNYTSAALKRADLLVKLCSRHAYISPDKLIKYELERAIDESPFLENILSDNGDWFPDINDIMPPIKGDDIKRDLDLVLKEKGMNRHSRRKAKKQAFKSGRLRPELQEKLASDGENEDFSDILHTYPMRPKSAKILYQYILGRTTKEKAENAFLDCLRDPCWMMRWYELNHHKMTPIIEWLRRPSRNLTNQTKELIIKAQQLLDNENSRNSNTKIDIFSASGWGDMQDQLLLHTANKLCSNLFSDWNILEDVNVINNYCPGLSTAIRTMHSVTSDSLRQHPRNPKNSDFPDAIHSMYAPYSTIFRADKYMSPHIDKYSTRYGTLVLDRLDEVPSIIREKLNTKGNKAT